MCGIIGYTGHKNSVPVLLEGLRTLEYRGYDSAGVAVCTSTGTIETVKSKGRIDLLQEKIDSLEVKVEGNCGIGHTRWATHGAPSDTNSHPHTADSLALVHNGIIENYAEIEEMLERRGYTFYSETDTEAAAKLIDYYYKKVNDPVAAMFEAAYVIRGSYAFGVMFRDFPGKIFAMRKDNPLIVASNDECGIIASDIPAILKHTNTYYQLEEGIVSVLCGGEIEFFDHTGKKTEQKRLTVDWNVEQAQKGGFPHFMIKEIHEEPEAIRQTVSTRLGEDGLPLFGVHELDGDRLGRFKSIHIVACGTAMHAGLVGKAIIEKLARVSVDVDVASEFRYRDPILLAVAGVGHIASGIYTGHVGGGRGTLSEDVARLVSVEVLAEDFRVGIVADGEEESVDGDVVVLLVGFALALHHVGSLNAVVAEEAGDVVLEENLNLGVLHDAVLHDLAGAEVVLAHDEVYLAGKTCEVAGLLTSGVATAHYGYHLLAVEEAVASGTGTDTHTGIFLLVLESEVLGRCTCGDDDGLGLNLGTVINSDVEGAL